jgi:UDPglucose--hexose-1-phosphate uridylyltransferase
MEYNNNWERRWHPILREWVILAATTADRPWSGARLKAEENLSPEFDPGCYLCPGVTRASGIKNPDYTKPFAFTNDFASFSFEAPNVSKENPFEVVRPVNGTCRVLCFTPQHNITLAELSLSEIEDVVALWKKEFVDLASNDKIKNILIFENKGKAIGVSNPHPHGQIYATGYVPKILERELESHVLYHKEHNSCIFCDLLSNEKKNKDRIVYENDHFIAFIPFFARFVYETYIVSKRHVSRISDFADDELKSLADIVKNVIVKFDNLYEMSFPNITMMHNAPIDGSPDNDLFHFHIEFYPPLRAPDKLKYLAGFESGGGNIINPVMPEEAAARMRNASTIHYKTGK